MYGSFFRYTFAIYVCACAQSMSALVRDLCLRLCMIYVCACARSMSALVHDLCLRLCTIYVCACA